MYSVRYNCTNCGHSFSESFPKGVKAPSTTICKNCGCYTASKEWPNKLRTRIQWNVKPQMDKLVSFVIPKDTRT